MNPDRDRVERELVTTLYRQMAPGLIALGTTSGIAVLATLLWVRVPGPLVIAWTVGHLALVAGWVLGDSAYRRRPTRDVLRWETWARVFATLSAAMWGIAALLFFDERDFETTAFLMVFYAGICVVCAVAFSASWSVVVPVTLAVVLPLALRAVASGHSTFMLLGLGQLTYLALILVASRRHHQSLRRATELQFKNEELLAEKTRFLAAASHDLRQPLHALNLFTELLEEKSSDAQQRQFIERIHASSRALNGLLDGLLEMSRIDSEALKPQRRHFAVNALLHELADETREHATRKGLEFELHVPSDEVIIDSDPELLARVVRNLLSNAVRYSDSGTIQLSLRSGPQLSVCDQGRGIAPQHQARVFEAFFQVGNPERDRERGLGLGLSIVRGLCQALGHRVTLISQPQRERGTEFTIDLPAGLAERVERTREPAPPTRGFHGARVLVIDDEAEVRSGMHALLSSWGCEPICVASLKETMAVTTAPAALICDSRLPDQITGVMALEQLEARFGPLKAIFVTGDTAPDQIRALKDTGRVVLFKPVSPGKLRAALSAATSAPTA
ncbi:MAG: hybrid sensor histidine kinase/response regulator [Archangium sp.]